MPSLIDHSQSWAFLLPIALAIFGAVFGSFATVLVHRIPAGKSLGGRSICPSCQNQIATRDNLPILGYIILRGRCRACGASFSSAYLWIEIGMSALFVAGAYFTQNWWQLLCWLITALFGLPLSIIDWRIHRLPNKLVLAFTIATAMVVALSSYQWPASKIWSTLLSSAALAAFFLILAIITRGGMGMGDVKLAIPLGLISARFGWPWLLVTGYAAFFYGAIFGIVAMARRRAGRKSAIAFGPFLILGQLTTFLLFYFTN